MNVNCDIVVNQVGDSGGKFKDNTK